ncbi:MAG: EAL domain-containing protein [Gammaproteobacteria bacterium]|nr:EAL domain-containing protein [Gammaproteobacteria bacterium]
MTEAPSAPTRSKSSPSIRFIEQFIGQRPANTLTGVLLGQLDSFNRISTAFGEDKASEFCNDYIERLRELFPSSTPIIRLAGRRFIVLTDPESMSAVMDAASCITEESQPQIQVGEDSFLVDVTVGISVHPTHGSDAATLLRRAELALQAAKDKEMAYDIYTTDATRQLASIWKMESDLSAAIRRGELEVYYQPKIELGESAVGGLEALVRWRGREGGFVPADNFVPLAESSGQIVPLTWLVFDRVLDAIQNWKYFDRPISLSVNVAPQLIGLTEFYSRLRSLKEALKNQNIDLTVELTEDSLLGIDEKALASLLRIRKLDVGLSIDDFGKGHSSLSYLKQIPANEIKIDKRFVESIATDHADQQIVKAVIELSHALDMRVVAEGVDSRENLEVISDLGCDMAQGFLIGRPMRSDHVVEWITCYSDSSIMRGVPTASVRQVNAEIA